MEPVLTFLPSTAHVGRLSITRSDRPIRLTLDHIGKRHHVDVADQSRFELLQPWSPDDPWEVLPVEGPSPDPGVWPLPAELVRWLAGSRAAEASGLLGALPAGEYALVRARIEPAMTRHVLLGNELVPSPPGAQELWHQQGAYACTFGVGGSARLDRPLFGLSLLESDGQYASFAVWFFDLAGPADPAAPASGDLVLVLPLAGELVYDAMSRFTPPDELAEVAGAWRQTVGPAFAATLAQATERAVR